MRNKAMGVKQFTLTGELVATYISQKAAALATNISKNSINFAVNGRRYHAGGFRWVVFELPRENKSKQVRNAILKKEVEEYMSYINRHEVSGERDCLMCGKRFMSKSNRNRRCPRCESKIDMYRREHPYSIHTDEPVSCYIEAN